MARSDQTREEIDATVELVRRGTEFFFHTVDAMAEEDYAAPSLLPGWSRGHVVAHVGYNAYGVARLADWATTGVEHPMYESAEARNREIERGATLNPQELRALNVKAAAELGEALSALPPRSWTTEVRTTSGKAMPASDIIWMRAREVWMHTVDLGTGASFADFPPEFLHRLLTEIVGSWQTRSATESLPSFVLATVDGQVYEIERDAQDSVVLRGTAADLASWATGRGSAGVSTRDGSPVPEAPAWM